MKRFVPLLLYAIPIISSAAGPSMKVFDLSIEQCELKEVVSRLQFEATQNGAAIAEQSLPILQELMRVNERAKIPDKPLKEQLKPDDIGKFTEISQRLKSTWLAQLMESRRERDVKVLQKMVVLADREYRWNDHPTEKDPDYIVHALLQLLRITVKKSDITVPKTPICSIEFALHSIENEAIEKLNSINVEAAMTSLEAILAKYKMEKLDRSRLSKPDLQKVNELLENTLEPAQRHSTFIQDIEHIKLMARVSEIIYESSKQDIAFGGGNKDAIGKTIQRRIEGNEFDQDTLIAMNLWTKINEKIPGDFVQDWAEFSKQLEKPDTGKKNKKAK